MEHPSQLMIKLPGQLHTDFRDYARRHRRSVSELLRHLMEEEMRSQRATTSMRPPLIEGRYGKAAPITADDGKVYHFQVVSFETVPHLRLYDPEHDYNYRPPALLKDTSSIIARLHKLEQDGYRWDTEEYRQLCVELGLDPDAGRPTYKLEDQDIVGHLENALDAASGDWRLAVFIRGLLSLLRTDHFPEFQTYETCQATLQNWTFKMSRALFQDALDRVETDRIASSTPVLIGIDFLPSWEGRGYTASLSLWSIQDSDPDGWSTDLYGHLGGVALLPVRQDRVTQTVVKRLTEQGVIFLTHDEARAYMDGEGAYWTFYQRSWNCPADLAPREPTATEKLHWRLRRPHTPLYDQSRSQSAA